MFVFLLQCRILLYFTFVLFYIFIYFCYNNYEIKKNLLRDSAPVISHSYQFKMAMFFFCVILCLVFSSSRYYSTLIIKINTNFSFIIALFIQKKGGYISESWRFKIECPPLRFKFPNKVQIYCGNLKTNCILILCSSHVGNIYVCVCYGIKSKFARIFFVKINRVYILFFTIKLSLIFGFFWN